MNLREEFEKETGNKLTYTYDDENCAFSYSKYIGWLESKLTESQSWRSPESAPKDGTEMVGCFQYGHSRYRVIVSWRRGSWCDEARNGVVGILLGWFPIPEWKEKL